jgi:hypothetical protein
LFCGNAITSELPNSQIYFTLPVSFSQAREIVDNHGVIPDYVITDDFDSLFSKSTVDRELEKAKELIGKMTKK